MEFGTDIDIITGDMNTLTTLKPENKQDISTKKYRIKTKEYICDENYMRHVGWQENNDCIKTFFDQKTVDIISKKATDLTQGVEKDGRPIIVSDKTICHVMSTVYKNHRPSTGDIYSRYTIAKAYPYSDMQELIDRTLEIIVSTIKNEYGMKYWNESLSIWSTLYGDFNEQKLRQHAPIKVLNKRSDRFQFNMNY